ncbi:MAG TPA: hypothetical protein PLN21_15970 [Gemmatales bacterium]|nr:hypothetical protein [Gemmatales bacterium]
MFAWLFAFSFSVIGIVLAKIVVSGAGKNNEPIYLLGFGIMFAILGALMGGSMDIVHVIKDRTTKPKKDKP